MSYIHRSSDVQPLRTAPATYDADAVDELRASRVPAGAKGWPPEAEGIRLTEIAGRRLRALDVPMPVMVLRGDAVRHNATLMAEFCREQGALFAPHGKTTMAPQVFAVQLDAGAWALTAATPAHLRIYRRFGVSRILFANQVTERSVARWIATELAADPAFELLCLVDSIQGVRLLDDQLRRSGLARPLPVLLEVGLNGMRAGCRTIEQAIAVAGAVARTETLQLAGVECFEGLATETAEPGTTPPEVEELLGLAAGVAKALLEGGALDPSGWLISGGGSAYFDRVAEHFAASDWGATGARLVLRSGCYITHDGGFYERDSPLAGRARGADPRLRNAIELWSAVLSRPEPGLVITSMGKRDAPHDMGMPVPFAAARGRDRRRLPPGARVTALSDQHAHIAVPADLELEVGDLVGCTVSHPCGALDRWRVVPAVDDDGLVVDGVVTFF